MTLEAPLSGVGVALANEGQGKERIVANTKPITFSRTGMIWMIVFFVVILIMLVFSLLPIKFAWFS